MLRLVERSGVRNGMALVYSPHTTCAVVINEREQGFFADFSDALDELVPSDNLYYRHDDLSIRAEGLEDDRHELPNGHSHVRAALLSSASQAIPIVEGAYCSAATSGSSSASSIARGHARSFCRSPASSRRRPGGLGIHACSARRSAAAPLPMAVPPDRS
jgi:secondary thiamine-phosphate synthase enzyme